MQIRSLGKIPLCGSGSGGWGLGVGGLDALQIPSCASRITWVRNTQATQKVHG